MKRNVIVYGFSKNAGVFIQPAIKYILGEVKSTYVSEIDSAWKQFSSADVICINCGMTFYEMGLCFNIIEKVCENLPFIVCLSWQEVPEENLDVMLLHSVPVIMFDLESEEEFALCADAVRKGKNYRAKNTYNRNERFYCDRIENYLKLSRNQKYAFHYMMCGKSQKEFQIDFGFQSLSTASSHWNMVLQKFNVKNVYELRKLFR